MPPYPEPDLLPISALQHLLFCERQAALIHVERLWVENRLTVEGRQLHRKAHDGSLERSGDTWTARSLRLRSFEFGLAGQADIVELQLAPGADRNAWPPPAGQIRRVTPVEYKRGRPKQDDSDRVQLCAQALCLEEMFGVSIVEGALFYGKQQRRTGIAFSADLRAKTVRAAARFREIIETGETPWAKREPKCESCSMITVCLPDAMRTRGSGAFVARDFARHLSAEGPTSDEFEALEPAL